MKIIGIDLGSREVKIIISQNDKIIKKIKIGTMNFYKNYCKFDKKIIVDMKKFDISDKDIAISTGYGRNNIDLHQFVAINEIKAHVYGAINQTGLKDFILLDIGGQDVKVAKIQNSMITDLELNDKCAASCGRYLENMANILEISLDKLTSYIEEPISLNSTCSVFSESELIGKIAEGVNIENLCAGVNFSLYKRIIPMLMKFKGRKLVLAGGVAKGEAIKKYLAKDYEEIICLDDPEYNGAIGCLVYGNMKKIILSEVATVAKNNNKS